MGRHHADRKEDTPAHKTLQMKINRGQSEPLQSPVGTGFTNASNAPFRPDRTPIRSQFQPPVSRPERTSTADHTRRDTHRRPRSARRSPGARDMRPGHPPSRRRHISSLRNYGLCGPMSPVEDTSPTATPMWHTKDLGRLIVLVVASSNSPVPVSPPGSR